MSQVTVTIAGSTYRIACDDGEEQHLEGLARLLDAKIEEMRAAFGEIGDMRLHVMAAITIADELAEPSGASSPSRTTSPPSKPSPMPAASATRISNGASPTGSAAPPSASSAWRAASPGRERSPECPDEAPSCAGTCALHWSGGAAGCVRRHISPGPYRSSRELSLAWSVDSGHTAPTYVVGSRDRSSDGFRGSAPSPCSMTLPARPEGPRSAPRRSPAATALGAEERGRAARIVSPTVLGLPDSPRPGPSRGYLADPQRDRHPARARGAARRGRRWRCPPSPAAGLIFRRWAPGDPLVARRLRAPRAAARRAGGATRRSSSCRSPPSTGAAPPRLRQGPLRPAPSRRSRRAARSPPSASPSPCRRSQRCRTSPTTAGSTSIVTENRP